MEFATEEEYENAFYEAIGGICEKTNIIPTEDINEAETVEIVNEPEEARCDNCSKEKEAAD